MSGLDRWSATRVVQASEEEAAERLVALRKRGYLVVRGRGRAVTYSLRRDLAEQFRGAQAYAAELPLDDEAVEPRVMMAGASREALDVQLTSGRQERAEGRYPKGAIEEVLPEALRDFDELPTPEREHEVKTEVGVLVTVPDFAWPDRKLAVYCDGYQYHGDRETPELDAGKRNFLQQRGWTVLTYWCRQILDRPDRCARQVIETWRARSEA